MIGKTISHYQIVEELGRGGMGVVYKAKDTKLDRFVALKFLPPHLSQAENEKKRFIHEAKAASALDHPNICSVYEINETDQGKMFIAMACYEGESLKEKIAKGPIPLEETLNLTTQIARGLEKAHAKKIVHRDIKPANILITEDNVVKIVDFGLAKLAGQTRLTRTGSTLGTVAYMSPEQAQSKPVDQRTDIWSLGVILYEMLTGRHPFEGEYEQAVIYSILNEEPEPLGAWRPDAPESLVQVVARALEKNPDKRYQSITEMLEDLNSISSGIVPEALKARMRKTKLLKRKWALIYSAGILVLIAGIVVISVLTKRARTIDSIAVLPLENLTGDTEQQYFVDGITDELIGQLGQISGLRRVISRTSVMRYKDTDKSLPEIARELNVDAIVEGTVYQIGDNVSIKLQLFDALPEERSLWTQRYDRPISDVLVMYGEMAGAIAENIQVKLTAQEETRLAGARQINPEVYDAYLKGMFHWQRLNPEDLEIALQYFESALEKDPDFALAHSGVALVLGFYGAAGMVPPNEVRTKVIAEAEKAVELDNTLAETHYALAQIRTWVEWDWEKAEESYLKTIELNPNYPDIRAYYSHYLFMMHRPDEAIVQMERTMELDFFNPLLQSLCAMDLLFMRRYDEAIDQFRSVLRSVPNHGVAADMLTMAYHQKGMYEEALEQKKTYYESLGLMDGVEALTRGYEEGGYREAMASTAQMWEELSHDTFILPAIVSEAYAYAGNKEKALEWLEKGVELGDFLISYLGVIPLYVDLLKDEPRYQDLLRKMNLPVGVMR